MARDENAGLFLFEIFRQEVIADHFHALVRMIRRQVIKEDELNAGTAKIVPGASDDLLYLSVRLFREGSSEIAYGCLVGAGEGADGAAKP